MSSPEGTTDNVIEGVVASPADVLDAYLTVYKKRVRQRPNAPFKAPLQNALLALLALRVGVGSDSRGEHKNALEMIQTSTRAILEKQSEHAAATDITGYVWASAYGTLPLEQPPLAQIQRVLDSGAAGGVAGMIGVAWRALFLATAWPLMHWEQRQRAAKELDRRADYLVSRLTRALAPATDEETLAVNQLAQSAAVVAELGQRLQDDELRTLAARAAERAEAAQRDDGAIPDVTNEAGAAATGHIAQFVVGVTNVGIDGAGRRALEYLLRQRVQPHDLLLTRDDEPSSPAEMSPWAPLALATQTSPRFEVSARAPRRAAPTEQVQS